MYRLEFKRKNSYKENRNYRNKTNKRLYLLNGEVFSTQSEFDVCFA